MSSNRLRAAAVGTALAVSVAGGVALAAAPLPITHSAYESGGNQRGGITYVISATNPKVVVAGAAAVGSQYALSGGSVLCPKAKRNPGFTGKPFAVFGFPAATFKLSHGRYTLTREFTQRHVVPLGSASAKSPFTLKLKITATVVNSTTITGTIKATGGSCTTAKAIKYTAKLNKSLPVAPGK